MSPITETRTSEERERVWKELEGIRLGKEPKNPEYPPGFNDQSGAVFCWFQIQLYVASKQRKQASKKQVPNVGTLLRRSTSTKSKRPGVQDKQDSTAQQRSVTQPEIQDAGPWTNVVELANEGFPVTGTRCDEAVRGRQRQR